MVLLGDWAKLADDIAKAAALDHYMQGHQILQESAQKGVEMAQEKLGHYQEGWPELAPATQAERERLGFPADEPLLRTGGLRDAIRIFDDQGDAISFGIAEGDEHWEQGMTQEHGSLGPAAIPPRPFLGPTAEELGPELAERVHVALDGVFNG